MVYRRRRFNRRRRSSRKRSLLSARLRPRRVAGFTRRVGRAVNRLAEKKYLNTGLSASIQSGSDQVILVSWQNVPTNSTVSGRVGNKIFIRYVLVNGVINNNNLEQTVIRGAFGYAKTQAALNPAFFPQTPLDFYDPERYIIMFQKTWHPGSVAENGRDVITFQWKIPVFKTLTFDSDLSTTIINRQFFFNFISNDSVIPSPSLTLGVRMTYTDI